MMMNALFSLPRRNVSSVAGRIVNEAIKTNPLFTNGREEVIDALVKVVGEKAKLESKLVEASGGAVSTSTLLGVPLGPNSSFLHGPAFAPTLIREAIRTANKTFQTKEGIDTENISVLADVGDVPVQELHHDYLVDDKGLMDVITKSVKEVMKVEPLNLRPLVLGGDSSISLPVVRAISGQLKGQVDILHFGAHHAPYKNEKYDEDSTFGQIMAQDYARNLVEVVGIRSKPKEGDQGNELTEVEYETKTFFKNRETFDKLELRKGASSENKKLGEGVRGVYVSINVDGLDPASFAPGVSQRESGGLSLGQVLNILKNLEGDIVGGDVVGYNPQRDTTAEHITAVLTARLVRGLAARMSQPKPKSKSKL